MRTPRRIHFALVAGLSIVTLAASGCSNTAEAPDAGNSAPTYDTTLGDSLGAALQRALDDGNADYSCWGMTAAVSLPGRGTWRGATGVDDLVTKSPMPRDGAFRIGSITKTFVATVFLQLAAEGKVSLDDKLSRFVPDYPGADTMTMRQVMSHTAGVYDYADNLIFLNTAIMNPQKVWAPKELLAYASSQKPYFAPGRGYHYSNTDYIFAGMAVEAVTGNPIHVEIRRRLLDPLQLKSAWFDGGGAESIPPGAHLVRGYEDTGRDLTHVYDMSASWAAGAMAAHAEDVDRFFTALQTGKLLDAKRLDEMRTVLGGGRYGIGLSKSDSPLGTAYGHNGLVLGYWTQGMWFEKSGVSVSVMCDVFTLPSRSPIKNAWDGILAALKAELD